MVGAGLGSAWAAFASSEAHLRRHLQRQRLAAAPTCFPLRDTCRWWFYFVTGIVGLTASLDLSGIQTYAARCAAGGGGGVGRLMHLSLSDDTCKPHDSVRRHSATRGPVLGAADDLTRASGATGSVKANVGQGPSALSSIAPLSWDWYILWLAWSMASKLRAQRVGVFVGRPVMVKQQKPPNVLLSHHLGAIELPPPLPIALSNQPSALSGQASGLSVQASSRLQEPDLQVAAREVLHLFRIVRKRPALPDLLHQNPDAFTAPQPVVLQYLQPPRAAALIPEIMVACDRAIDHSQPRTVHNGAFQHSQMSAPGAERQSTAHRALDILQGPNVSPFIRIQTQGQPSASTRSGRPVLQGTPTSHPELGLDRETWDSDELCESNLRSPTASVTSSTSSGGFKSCSHSQPSVTGGEAGRESAEVDMWRAGF
ncbi:MAG: hypothetical protein WDW38_008923 [Sanguina aurantia]